MIKKILFIVFCFILFPSFVLAQDVNAGFVSGIWYSKFPFFSGENIKIYSAVQNHSGSSISGKVFLYDFNDLIGGTNFFVDDGELVDIGIDWIAIQGNHSFRLEITGADGGLISNSLMGREVFVDLDTDNDEIGNREDPDDDNDGLSDEIEQLNGLDPLNIDTDQDGIEDSLDLSNEFKYEENLNQIVQGSVEKVSDLGQNAAQKSLDVIKDSINRVRGSVDEQKKEIVKDLESEKDSFSRKIYLATLSLIDFTLNNNVALYFVLLVVFLLVIRVFELIMSYFKK